MSAPSFLLPIPTRARLLLHALLIAAAVVLACGLLPSGTASAAAPAIDLCNGSDNVGGEEVRCEVTISNSLDLATGIGSSTVTVQECHGAAGAPTCRTDTTSFNDVTTSVSLCNGSGSGGGGIVACSVRISNTITGDATTTPATVNQCNGSGQGGGTEPTVQCSPVGSTTGATITQCNDAGNGGGATLRVRCQVDPSTQSAALPVSINQCNGSGNGGGATVTCRSAITNDIRAAQAAPAPSAAPSAAPATSPTPAASATPAAATPTPSSTSPGGASASPSTAPAPTSSTPAAPAPVVAEPSPASSPAAPVAGAPVAGAPISGGPPAVPVGSLPQSVLPVEAPHAAAIGGSAGLTGSPTLPRTGADAGSLTLLGLLLTVGGSFLLLVGRAPRPVGRHERPSH